MPASVAAIRQRLANFELTDVFREELGWDRFRSTQPLALDGRTYALEGIAAKHGFQVFKVLGDGVGDIPDRATRMRIDREVTKFAYEHMLVFVNGELTTQAWHWTRRERGKPLAAREEWFGPGQTGQRLAERLAQLTIGIDEEEQLTLPDVAGRVKGAFDVERVTKRFYDRFKTEHAKFLEFIEGIQDQGDREWYASLMLNRVMFVYFIQKRGFLDGDQDYLRNRLHRVRSQRGPNQFLSFYRQFLLRLFHEGLGKQSQMRGADFDALLGHIPYVNGGLFEFHQLEAANPNIDIPDEAFERLFEFFDGYRWHLDERPLREDNEINPDVLGYIFEKYINQKQMGAYYTKEDITGYIAGNTVLPFVLDAARKECAIAFHPGGEVWSLLAQNPDRYIYDAVEHGVYVPLPEEIEAGITKVSKREGWNRPADSEFALPTETWREHVARRTRCLELGGKLAAGEVATADDLITFNLDIAQFTQDAIDNADGPELVRAFWKALQRVTILDPACGSGAFLFAALNLLEPLYDACLRRMASFVEELDRSGDPHRPEKLSDFRETLAELDRHPNRRHFVLKSIILDNLYGVDIIEEAVEICKLRLFLKLVAQVDRADQVEPLPDIDFNIRAGNTLVGFATYEEVRKAVLGDLQGKMDLDGSMQRIDEEAEKADFGFEQFREIQRKPDFDAADLAEAKKLARRGLRALSDELDRYLAREYGIDPMNLAAFAKWRSSHQPFHWFAEFYGIMKAGGFDVVIGNPPWREYSSVKDEYRVRGYSTEPCRNLHGICTERALALRAPVGRASFIVQLPLVSSTRMSTVRECLVKESGCLHVIPFGDRPGRLFDGLEHCRAVIFLSRAASTPLDGSLFITPYQRWYTEERWDPEKRPILFQRICYFAASSAAFAQSNFGKVGEPLIDEALRRIWSSPHRIAHVLAPRATPSFLFYQEATEYWVKATIGLPFYARNGTVGAPPHGRHLYLQSQDHAPSLYALINSSLFWVYFITYGDCFHLSEHLVETFPIPPGILDDAELSDLGQRLAADIRRNAAVKTIAATTGDEISYEEFVAHRSKSIIDEIDRVLGSHYGLTETQLDFIRNYEAKYRLGSDATDDASLDE